MNRSEFMSQLERLLMDIPESDRQDAIAYYNDYFDEAGKENEARVIQELGSPGRVAAMMKADLKGNGYGSESHKDENENPPVARPKEKNKSELFRGHLLLYC